MVIPESQPYILPLTVAVLLALFLLQPFGTARIGKIFGPVMALWFLAIAALGVRGIINIPRYCWPSTLRTASRFCFRTGTPVSWSWAAFFSA